MYTGQDEVNIPRDVTNVIFHPSVKAVKERAFSERLDWTSVNLDEGLEEIGEEAFYKCSYRRWGGMTVELGDGVEYIGKKEFFKCTSLRRIMIPRAVKVIHQNAFYRCSQLRKVEFCPEIEDESREFKRDWWNHGVHVRSLST